MWRAIGPPETAQDDPAPWHWTLIPRTTSCHTYCYDRTAVSPSPRLPSCTSTLLFSKSALCPWSTYEGRSFVFMPPHFLRCDSDSNFHTTTPQKFRISFYINVSFTSCTFTCLLHMVLFSVWHQRRCSTGRRFISSPLLFSIFINLISRSLTSSYYLYVDGLKIYIHGQLGNLHDAIQEINSGQNSTWSKQCGLKLYATKTQMIIIGISSRYPR